MNAALWITQGVLAAVFAASGYTKSRMSRDELLASGQTGAASFPTPVVRSVAFMEMLAAIGLVLPWLTGIAKFLTPAAAAGLCIIMVGAVSFHIRLRGAPQHRDQRGALHDGGVRGDRSRVRVTARGAGRPGPPGDESGDRCVGRRRPGG